MKTPPFPEFGHSTRAQVQGLDLYSGKRWYLTGLEYQCLNATLFLSVPRHQCSGTKCEHSPTPLSERLSEINFAPWSNTNVPFPHTWNNFTVMFVDFVGTLTFSSVETVSVFSQFFFWVFSCPFFGVGKVVCGKNLLVFARLVIGLKKRSHPCCFTVGGQAEVRV